MKKAGVSIYFYPFLGLLFFCLLNVSTVSSLLPLDTTYDLQRLIELLLLAVVNLILFASSDARKNVVLTYLSFSKITRILLALFFACGIIAAGKAALPKYAFLQIATVAELFILMIFTATLKRQYREQFDRIFLAVLFISVLYYALTALNILLGYMRGELIANTDLNTFLGAPFFTNSRFLVQFLVMLLPFLALSFEIFPKKWLWPLFYLVGAYVWCLGFLNQSRAFTDVVLLSFIALLIFFGKSALRYISIELLMALGGLALFLLLYHFPAQVGENHLLSTMVNDRLMLWRAAFEMIRHHPWFGVGPLHYPFYVYPVEQYAAHPHNALLEVAAEWGLPAFILLFTLLLRGFWHFLKSAVEKINQGNSLLPMVLTASLVSAFIDANVSGLIVTPMAQVMLILIIGYSLGLQMEKPFSSISTEQKLSFLNHSVLIMIILVSAFFMANTLKKVMSDLPEINSRYFSICTNGCMLSPNYFAQGFIQFYETPPLQAP